MSSTNPLIYCLPEEERVNFEKEVRSGDRVFKVISVSANDTIREIDMVNTFLDYQKRISSHKYDPLLFLSPFELRIAYLYGCLNLKFGDRRDETFKILTRKKQMVVWVEWFMVLPYVDEM